MQKETKPTKVAILGAGVIGVTLGIILNIHGFRTKIYAEHLADKIHPFKPDERPPEFATIHAAASIIPHSVNHPKATSMLDISQKFFHRLAFSATSGVRVQRHYELFEQPTDPPEYARTIKDFTLLPKDGRAWEKDKNIPHRKNAKGVWGWHFNIFFAEEPTYIQRLYDLYISSGGTFIECKMENAQDFYGLDGEILVNCSGRWATELFPEDKKNTKLVRGHMVRVQIYHVPHDFSNQYFSYNYTPSIDTYYRIDKNGKKLPADVYFYPRSDGWLFGGSRQEGYPEIGKPWREEDEQIAVEKFKKPGWVVEIPKPIWDLNRELILGIAKLDIADPKYSSNSLAAYRFARDPIRIEKDKPKGGKMVLHNYGHGGAGYTLSWGSAYEILKLIESEKGKSRLVAGNKMRRGNILPLLSILEDLAKEELETNKNGLKG